MEGQCRRSGTMSLLWCWAPPKSRKSGHYSWAIWVDCRSGDQSAANTTRTASIKPHATIYGRWACVDSVCEASFSIFCLVDGTAVLTDENTKNRCVAPRMLLDTHSPLQIERWDRWKFFGNLKGTSKETQLWSRCERFVILRTLVFYSTDQHCRGFFEKKKNVQNFMSKPTKIHKIHKIVLKYVITAKNKKYRIFLENDLTLMKIHIRKREYWNLKSLKRSMQSVFFGRNTHNYTNITTSAALLTSPAGEFLPRSVFAIVICCSTLQSLYEQEIANA